MADATKPDPVLDELRRYGNQLVPGGAEQLAGQWQFLASRPRGAIAEEVSRRLATFGGKYLNPEYVPPAGPRSPLRAVLERNADLLAGGAKSIDKVMARLAVSLAGKDPHEVAGAVIEHLGKRENHDLLAAPPPRPKSERNIELLLNAHFGEVPTTQRAALAEDVTGRFGQMPDDAIVRHLATMLRFAPVAAKYGLGKPLDAKDPRQTMRPEPTPKAAGEGEPRRNNVF
jgi:hypothetical protein